jgi:hypothetical protein
MLHVWYCKLLPPIAAKILPQNNHVALTFGKMALDQIVFAPIILSGFFIAYSTFAEGDPLKGANQIK